MGAGLKLAVTGAIALLSAATPSFAATLVNVHFTGPQRLVSPQVGAGVIGQAGDVWNQLKGETGSASLIAADNSASGYTISYAAQGSYASEPSYTQFTGTPYANLMQGYLYSSGKPISLTISGLKANELFNLYAITQGDNNTTGRRHDLTVNGVSASNLNTNTNSFVAGDNYALFSGRADALGRITLLNAPGIGEANLNGFQLASAVPEPATWAMMIFGVGSVGGALRRRRSQAHGQLRTA